MLWLLDMCLALVSVCLADELAEAIIERSELWLIFGLLLFEGCKN